MSTGAVKKWHISPWFCPWNFNDFLWSDVHYFLKTFTASGEHRTPSSMGPSTHANDAQWTPWLGAYLCPALVKFFITMVNIVCSFECMMSAFFLCCSFFIVDNRYIILFYSWNPHVKGTEKYINNVDGFVRWAKQYQTKKSRDSTWQFSHALVSLSNSYLSHNHHTVTPSPQPLTCLSTSQLWLISTCSVTPGDLLRLWQQS